MRKAFTLLVIMVAVFALTSAVYAGKECSVTKAAAEKIKISDKTCSPEEIAACARARNISPEECAKLCADGKIIKHTLSIEGMTCVGCEKSITGTLEKLNGVVHVLSIDHKDGNAVVCIDPSKCEPTSLVKAVTQKGYKAKIIPAVAKTTSASKIKDCSKICTAKERAACAVKVKKGDGSK